MRHCSSLGCVEGTQCSIRSLAAAFGLSRHPSRLAYTAKIPRDCVEPSRRNPALQEGCQPRIIATVNLKSVWSTLRSPSSPEVSVRTCHCPPGALGAGCAERNSKIVVPSAGLADNLGLLRQSCASTSFPARLQLAASQLRTFWCLFCSSGARLRSAICLGRCNFRRPKRHQSALPSPPGR